MPWARGRLRLLAVRLRPLVPVAAITALLAFVPFDTCLLKRTIGIACPGCGFTRALLALVQGEVRASIGLHPLALPAIVLGALTLALAFALPEGHPCWVPYCRRAIDASAALLVLAWIARLLRWLPPV